MLVNTLPLVNYFSTLLAGKEDKCFDLAVSGILFLSDSLIELGSNSQWCWGAGAGAPKHSPVATPEHPELGLPVTGAVTCVM